MKACRVRQLVEVVFALTCVLDSLKIQEKHCIVMQSKFSISSFAFLKLKHFKCQINSVNVKFNLNRQQQW